MQRNRDTKKAEELFSVFGDKMLIRSCLEKTMGEIYTVNPKNPDSAVAMIGDFCFYAGVPNLETVKYRAEDWKKEMVIMVPANEGWSRLIEQIYQEKARRFSRYAIKKEKNVWNLEKLRQYVNGLPKEYVLKRIDRAVYDEALKYDWSKDLVSQFPSWEEYEAHGIGVVVLFQGELVSGASSYTWCTEGIEIEIDTREDFRRKGLALVCGAELILECVKAGRYPGWDAHNMASVRLAEKLGYHLEREYVAYEVSE